MAYRNGIAITVFITVLICFLPWSVSGKLEVFSVEKDVGNCKETSFTADEAPVAKAGIKGENEEIKTLIADWKNEYLRNHAKSGLLKSEHFRIDLQAQLKDRYNLQIQLNAPRKPGESTTVSQVLMPVDPEIPDRYVRKAFWESFDRQAKVTVEVKPMKGCVNKNVKG